MHPPKDSAGNVTTNEYDAFNNPVRTVLPDGAVQLYTYDFNGNVLSFTNGEGETEYYTYDGLSRQTSRNIDGKIYKTYYDYRGNKAKETDPKGNVIEYEYNERGFNTLIKAYSNINEGLQTEYEYDNEGRVKQYSYGAIENINERHTYKNILDYRGNVVETIDNMGNAEYNKYNNGGNVIHHTDKNGVVTEYFYDALGRKIKQTNSDTGTIEYEYNNFNELIKISEEDEYIKYIYDTFGNVLSMEDSRGLKQDYTYDINGNMLSFNSEDERTGVVNQKYTYNSLNLVTGIITPLGTENISYDKAGRVIKSEINGREKKYEYNGDSTVKGIITRQDGKLVFSESYEYDKNGNKIYSDENGRVTKYAYDGLNRLIRAEYNGAKTTEYEFDGFNNIKKEYECMGTGVNTRIYNYDANNRLILKTDNYGIEQYEYDNQGNMVSRVTGVGNDVTKEYYRYDGYNRLEEYISGENFAEYEYALDGLRRSKTVNGEKTHFTYFGGNIITETNDVEIYKYYRGTEIIGYEKNNSERVYYRQNHHGDVLAILNAENQELDTYTYNAYGKEDAFVFNPMGNDTIIYQWKAETEKIHNPFGYCGEYKDDETGLIYLRNRYYDPTNGRFITEDPIKDGVNWYSYCGGNPVMFVDMWGLKYVWIRDLGNVNWNENTKTAELNDISYYEGDGKGTFIQQDKMYVWDETVYNDMGWYVTDRMKAVNYALKYGGDSENGIIRRNSEYKSFPSNCTNFVSQCLLEGSFQMDEVWWYDFNRPFRENSAAWGVADNLYRYLTGVHGFSISYIANKGDISNVANTCSPGDVIAWNNLDDVAPGIINHTAIISKVENGIIYYCGNTSDRTNRNLTNDTLNGDLYIVHIKYPDE